MLKVFPALSLDFVSGELPLCGEMEWVNQGSGQAQHQATWFMPWSHKSWVGDVSPEAVYSEKTCLHAGILSAMQGYHRRLHRAGKISASGLSLFFRTLSTWLSVRPCCPRSPLHSLCSFDAGTFALFLCGCAWLRLDAELKHCWQSWRCWISHLSCRRASLALSLIFLSSQT